MPEERKSFEKEGAEPKVRFGHYMSCAESDNIRRERTAKPGFQIKKERKDLMKKTNRARRAALREEPERYRAAARETVENALRHSEALAKRARAVFGDKSAGAQTELSGQRAEP